MRYIDIDLYVIKSDISFITNAILTQMHCVFEQMPLAVDFPHYKANTENSTEVLNSKILFASSGNKIRLFTLDANLTKEALIETLDLSRLVAAEKIEVSDWEPVPLTTKVVMYYRDRTMDKIKATNKKLMALRSNLKSTFKADEKNKFLTRDITVREQELRAGLDGMAKDSIASAHLKINVNRESLSTDKLFSMLLIRSVVEHAAISTSFDGLSSYGVSKGVSSPVYLPKF